MTGYRILVGSRTDRITTLLLDPNGPTLSVTSEVKVGLNPTWLTAHPTDPSLVYASLEQSEGAVVALKFDDRGHGTVVDRIPSCGADPASLLASAKALFAGNYSCGTILVTPVATSPPYFLNASHNNDHDSERRSGAPQCTTLQLSGSGPNVARQQSSHPHQVAAVPGRNELLVPDLGADKTWRIIYDDGDGDGRGGTLSVQGEVAYAPGSGPRHVVFHDGILYTLNELANTLTAHRLPQLPASPTLLSTTPSSLKLPPPSAFGDRLAGEILLAPALASHTDTKADADVRTRRGDSEVVPSGTAAFLYVTNRNNPSTAGDTLAIFSLDPDPAAPKLVTEVHTGLQHLRGAVIGGEDARWVVLGGAQGGGVKVYERVDGGRSVREVVALPDIETPVAFLWLPRV